MAHEYVFRGERKPYAPDPEDLRAREKAIRDAELLVNRDSEGTGANRPIDALVEQKVADYQVGGIDSFGATSRNPAAPSGSSTG